MFDDANWEGVVEGADEGIKQSNLTPMYSKKMLNKVEDSSQWWNGLYIVVVVKEPVDIKFVFEKPLTLSK